MAAGQTGACPWLESVLLNDLSPERRSGLWATPGIGQQLWDYRGHTERRSPILKKQEGVFAHSESGSCFFSTKHTFFRHLSPIWSYSQAFLLYLMHFLRSTSIFPQREDVKVMPDTQICTEFYWGAWYVFEWLLANARGHGPTVEAGAKSTYGHRASREYKGQTPFMTD